VTLTTTDDPIGTYQPPRPGHDELMLRPGTVRPHWARLAAAYRGLGTIELARRQNEIGVLLEQDGVTYNVATPDGRPQRPWRLDAVPLVLPSEEWAVLEGGVVQRAELLNLVLEDLYGSRRLLRAGLIPPVMVLSDPSFLRPLDGVRLPGPKQLPIHAVDLTRARDGRWTAMGDRTQAPSGAGYAMQNRIVVSKVFPSLYRNAEVHRLAPYSRALRSALQAAAPADVDDPSIVILSPGPFSETAFEHAFVATLLGYPLVEGADLEVRHGRVWLRTVAELAPVDVILRRVDAWFTDPLELLPDSTLGVAGLVESARSGAVSVVNPLGAGVLENAGLATRLPALSAHLLGEELKLATVPSWWCGEAAGRSHVIANLDHMVIRPTSRLAGGRSIDGTRLDAAGRDDLARRIAEDPETWVGQEWAEPVTAPVLDAGALQARGTVLRTFAVAREHSYSVMTGGLARSAPADDVSPITNPAGAIAKDTWVLSSEPESLSGFWIGGTPGPIATAATPLPARAAENLFWLGRYAERAEATVRLLRTVHARRTELQHVQPGPGSAALVTMLQAVTRVTGCYPGFVGDDAGVLLADPGDELLAVVADQHRVGAVAHAVARMFDAIDVVRDQLSIDTWLVVGSLQRELARIDDAAADREEVVIGVLNAVLHGLLALSGLAADSLIRDHGWHFMDAGRRIERGLQLTTLVGALLGERHDRATESIVTESTLVTAESIITYRRRYRSHALVSTVLDMLFSDAGNPRALRFQLDRLSEDVAVLDGGRPDPATSQAAAAVYEATTIVHRMDPARLATPDGNGRRTELERFAATMNDILTRVSNAIGADNFTRLLPQHSVVAPAESPW
jgi:uncharacterized circularly permuted ATP-grasp superfamily protein/uncharacterized alpha-E superfamily protein